MASAMIDVIAVAVSAIHRRDNSYPCLYPRPGLSLCNHPLIARPAYTAGTCLPGPFRQIQTLEKVQVGLPISDVVMGNDDTPDSCFSPDQPAVLLQVM